VLTTVTTTATGANVRASYVDPSITIPENTTYTFCITDFGLSGADSDPSREIELTTMPDREAGFLKIMGDPLEIADCISVDAIRVGDLTFTATAKATDSICFSFHARNNSSPGKSAGSRDPTYRRILTISIERVTVEHEPLVAQVPLPEPVDAHDGGSAPNHAAPDNTDVPSSGDAAIPSADIPTKDTHAIDVLPDAEPVPVQDHSDAVVDATDPPVHADDGITNTVVSVPDGVDPDEKENIPDVPMQNPPVHDRVSYSLVANGDTESSGQELSIMDGKNINSRTTFPGSGAVRRLKGISLLFLATVVVPTLLAIIYFGFIASDVYISESRFVVRSPERQSASPLGFILRGAGFSRAEDDAFAVQGFILSRDAMRALDEQLNIKQAFQFSISDIEVGRIFRQFNSSLAAYGIFCHFQFIC